MSVRTIVVVGAGSASFGLEALKGLLYSPDLDGVRIRLHDIDAEALERMHQLATLAVRKRGLRKAVESTTDPARALDGADVVVLSIAQDREKTWATDREIALRHGINHYAENGGPGAIAHTARNIALLLPILAQMEKKCPDAWLINYTNPVARMCTAVRQYSKIRCIGVCHQLDHGYYMAGVLLHDLLGIRLPRDYHFKWNDKAIEKTHAIAAAAHRELAISAAGLNHFTWALSVARRSNGEDLYPALRERNASFDAALGVRLGAGKVGSTPRIPRRTVPFEPLTRRVFDLFGMFPIPGDTHLCEYLPFTHSLSRRTWERMDIQMYDFYWSTARRDAARRKVRRIIHDKDLFLLDKVGSERAETLAAAIINGTPLSDEALNLPNGPPYAGPGRSSPPSPSATAGRSRRPSPQAGEGRVGGPLSGTARPAAIANLPAGAIVEAPAVFHAGEPRLQNVGRLPGPIAELCRRQILINELSVAGIVEHDRAKLLQALALDPMIDDPDLPPVLLDAYLGRR